MWSQAYNENIIGVLQRSSVKLRIIRHEEAKIPQEKQKYGPNMVQTWHQYGPNNLG